MVARTLTVVQMLPELKSGGVERGTLEVGAYLSRLGHRSIVISGGGRLVPKLTEDGSTHIEWGVGVKSPLTLRYIWPLRRLLVEKKVDILHVRSRVPAWIGYLAWKTIPPFKRPSFVTTVHGFYSVHSFSAVMMKGESVIAVSESIKRYIEESFPSTTPDRICVIHRGIDPDEFPQAHSPSEAWSRAWHDNFPELKGKFVIAMVGRLSRLKGHLFFAGLIKRLLDRGMPVHGLVVGGHEDENSGFFSEFRRFINANNLQSHITFTGFRRDVKDIMASVDLVTSFTQKPESFGRSVLEALSLGVPVAGFEHGGVGELLERIFPQGLVRVNDMDHALEVITHIHKHRPLPLRTHPFTLDKMLKATIDQYDRLVEEKKRIR
ncbi:MAG: glycosyltransferase family 4 protein [Desulfatiglans sp.]|nr:glycosyltransferase family 4 protein [Thermodesulfobacteriota bacterium]MEE4351507.1 glycosyltransferase family 4 protein [Desulfatiglans sp.]